MIMSTAIAAFNTDGFLYRTSNFYRHSSIGGPRWDRINLAQLFAGSDTVQAFAVDPFSPFYLQTGIEINGWLATTIGIYYLNNIFDDQIIVNLQHTFADPPPPGSTPKDHRVIQASPITQGRVMCIHYGGAGTFGTKAVYTTNGVTWSESPITTFSHNLADAGHVPPLFLSTSNQNVAYAGAYSASNQGKLYKTTDFGVNWTPQTKPDNFGNAAGGWVHIPDSN